MTMLWVSILLWACTGKDGVVGEPGLNSLVLAKEEPAGQNCSFGGLRIESGLDINMNNLLDSGEVTMTEFACNGTDAQTTLSTYVTLPKGAVCANGGIQLNMGIDNNENAVLEPEEITTIVNLCNGTLGTTTLTRLTSAPIGTKCGLGGVQIDWGTDINGNGQLDLEEIENSDTICNGETGDKSLVNIANNNPDENCLDGGIIISSGLDANANNILEDDEIGMTRFVCDGIDGRPNEEIRILLYHQNGGSSGYRNDYAINVLQFNINNWENATEVYLSATIRTSNSNNTATAELTDRFGRVIANSAVSTTDTEFRTVLSDNFFEYIPDGETTLRLFLGCELSDELIYITGKTELIIVQHQP